MHKTYWFCFVRRPEVGSWPIRLLLFGIRSNRIFSKYLVFAFEEVVWDEDNEGLNFLFKNSI